MAIVANGTASGIANASGSSSANAKKKVKKTRKALHIAAPKMKSRRKARQVTTDFHRLTHEVDKVKKDKALSGAEKQTKLAELNEQIDAIGGRTAYQDASFHKTSKWVFQLLTKFGLRPKSKEPPLRVLEVGAINTQLLTCPWLNVRAIDLNSRHERIEQRDFFDLKAEGEFQVLVSSMVLNCVPDAVSRGKMLKLYYEHLQPSGHLFLMIPLLCLRNSKFMTYARFVEILKAVGFFVKETKDSPKVSFFCLEKKPESIETATLANASTTVRFPHKLLVQSDKRNSFSVVL
ncbi:Rrna methyltransferase, partial [Globisporangium splendens]